MTDGWRSHSGQESAVLAWAGLLLLSALLALTFAALGARHPVSGGVVVYVREGLGAWAADSAGVCFLTAVLIGAPAVALIGGYYVADLTHSGTGIAAGVGAVRYGRCSTPGCSPPPP